MLREGMTVRTLYQKRILSTRTLTQSRKNNIIMESTPPDSHQSNDNKVWIKMSCLNFINVINLPVFRNLRLDKGHMTSGGRETLIPDKV